MKEHWKRFPYKTTDSEFAFTPTSSKKEVYLFISWLCINKLWFNLALDYSIHNVKLNVIILINCDKVKEARYKVFQICKSNESISILTFRVNQHILSARKLISSWLLDVREGDCKKLSGESVNIFWMGGDKGMGSCPRITVADENVSPPNLEVKRLSWRWLRLKHQGNSVHLWAFS